MSRSMIRFLFIAVLLCFVFTLRRSGEAQAQARCCTIYDCTAEDNAESCTSDTGENCSWDGPVNYCSNPSTGCRSGDEVFGGQCCYTPHSPIVIDTDGRGFHLTNYKSGVFFPITAQNTFIRTAWTVPESGNAWLVLDRNGNGRIDNGTELFGNFTAQPENRGKEPNGFLALAEFDKPSNGGNGNGLIDPSDSVYHRLKLWKDANHDGVSQATELFSLPDLGVFAIELSYATSSRKDEFGNSFRYRSRIFRSPGTPDGRWAWDVLLTFDDNF